MPEKKAKKDLKEAEEKAENATNEQEKADWENLIGVYDGRQLA